MRKDLHAESPFRLIYRVFWGKHKLKIAALVLLAFLAGIFEGIGINLLVPLFSLIAGAEYGANDFISSRMAALFEQFGYSFDVPVLLTFVIGLFVLKTIVVLFFSYWNVRIMADYEKETRLALLKHTVRAKWRYLIDQRLGYLEQVILTDVNRSQGYLSLLSTTVMTVINLLVYVIVAINLDAKVTIGTLAIGALIILVITPAIRKIKALSARETKRFKEISHHINQSVLGMKSIKAMNIADAVTIDGERNFQDIKDIRLNTFYANILPTQLNPLIAIVAVCAIFYVSYISPDFNFAVTLTVVYLIKQMFTYMKRVQTHLIGIHANYPYLLNVHGYEQAARDEVEHDRGTAEFVLKKDLTFSNVSFSYGSKASVLHDVSFNVPVGSSLAIIGPSGAGKTTIVDLILRLFEPNKGNIAVDGTNIDTISLADLRDNIGYVSQDIFLINDTIYNNIAFHNPTLTKKDIEQAAKDANIYDTITAFENGFDTVVGDRGIRLSGGQRQRIIIARILARKPQLLILDEATSALDNESEAHIQDILKALSGKVTMIMIAHRLSTIQHADQIIALDGGTVIESGTPQALLKNKKSYYATMHALEKTS